MYKYRVHYVIDGKTEDSFKDFDWFTDDMKIVGLANEKVV